LQYDGLPHLVVPVITDNSRIVFALRWAVAEMEDRLMMFAKAGFRNIVDFNSRESMPQSNMFSEDGQAEHDLSLPKSVPYIVIAIDDFADAMENVKDEIEPEIARLTATARAAGIHLVLVTQRPDAKVLTETIRANVPGRIAFRTANSVDSEVILDDSGAEHLIGNGDCLFKRKDGTVCRAQAPYIGDAEIDEIVVDAKQKWGVMHPSKSYSMDYDLQKAIEVIKRTKTASTSHFQRQLGYGYNHAAELMDRLEEEGYVAPQDGTGPRKINWEKFGE
jgi:S-DNA-T family DNA segregation ATPase FtsK/SpoIIIE